MYRFEIEKVGKGYLGVLFKGDKKSGHQELYHLYIRRLLVFDRNLTS